jgi:predicted ferric reductase
MPSIQEFVGQQKGLDFNSVLKHISLVESSFVSHLNTLVARVNIPTNSTFNATRGPPGIQQALTADPFKLSWRYGLPWVLLPVIFIGIVCFFNFYHFVTDGVRSSVREQRIKDEVKSFDYSFDPEYELKNLETDKSTTKFFPTSRKSIQTVNSYYDENPGWDLRIIHVAIAIFRFVFYRPAPAIVLKKGWRPIELPTLTTLGIAFVAAAFSALIIFVPQPLYWQSLAFGSPPVAIRSGMMAIALVPWVVALAMKVNFVSFLTGLGHERLNVFHRWSAYLCLLLSLIHTIPFFVQKINDPVGYATFTTYFNTHGVYIFATGFAALAPLIFLCVHSLPILRRMAYELFVLTHTPVAMVFVGMMFWHTKNALATYDFLYATIAIWGTALVARVFFMNWSNPRRLSWLIGEDASVTLMPENAAKITIPSQMNWKPGQYVYLRMPGVAIFDNHPFTIASLCSEDLPSDYGPEYRDMVLVFRPYGGFTRTLVDKALEKGPYHTYRAFVDGPYGGMKRKLHSFDKVILIAGGSGITALVSHLLDLIKRMREGKTVTTSIHVIWAMRRPEILDWFKEELRICRECAPPESVKCQFFITAAKRYEIQHPKRLGGENPSDHIATYFREHLEDAFQGIADKRASYISKRNSAYIRDEADGDIDYEAALREENEDVVASLPKAHLQSANTAASNAAAIRNFSHPMPPGSSDQGDEDDADEITPSGYAPHSGNSNTGGRNLALDVQAAIDSQDPTAKHMSSDLSGSTAKHFSFGFPSTPTEFQKNLMRFAFLPATTRSTDGWSTEYGRPDLPYMLQKEIGAELGKRTCVFVCGPPSMRVAVTKTVSSMQRLVLDKSNGVDEIFLHTENYAI